MAKMGKGPLEISSNPADPYKQHAQANTPMESFVFYKMRGVSAVELLKVDSAPCNL